MAAERSLQRQVALTISAAILGVMALAMVCAVLVLKRAVEQRIDGRLVAAATQLQGAVSRSAGQGISLEDGLTDPVFEDRTSGWGWVVREGQRVLARSRSLATDTSGGGNLALGGLNEVQMAEGARRAITVRLRGEDSLSATVVAPQAAVWAEVSQDIVIVLTGIAALALLLVAVAFAQARRALRPVETLAGDLEKLKAGAVPALPTTPFRELNQVMGLINELTAERLLALDESKGRAARLAHALKTPLAVLAARFGESGTTPDPKVVAAVEGMNRMIRLNLADARAGRASAIRPAPVPLLPIIDDLVVAFRHTIRRADVTVVIKIPASRCIPIPLDDAQELFGNLLENAFRHAASEIRVTAAGNTVAIRNDGEAFPSAELAAFAAADSSEGQGGAESPSGGLGLRIAQRILHRYGGELAIANEPGSVAAVTIRFAP
jgi:signal transduction histidine kinase